MAPLFDKTPASRWCRFGRLLFPMLLVRQVARPDGALLCAVELLPDDAGGASAENLPRNGFRGAATSST
ncbi:MAG: hypothetical protein ACI3YW_03335 [Candidatus Egerieousia sp.]